MIVLTSLAIMLIKNKSPFTQSISLQPAMSDTLWCSYKICTGPDILISLHFQDQWNRKVIFATTSIIPSFQLLQEIFTGADKIFGGVWCLVHRVPMPVFQIGTHSYYITISPLLSRRIQLHSKITIFRVPSLLLSSYEVPTSVTTRLLAGTWQWWYCEGTLTEVLRRYSVTGCT